MKNIKYANNFAFDEPCNYKGLLIYPVKVRQYTIFNYMVDCLLIDKNSIPDAKVISMSYLDFLFSSATPENKNIERLLGLFFICTKTDVEKICPEIDEKNRVVLSIDGIRIQNEDFDAIKEIILEQNLIEVPDYTIQKEIRDKIDEGKRIRGRQSKNKFAGLEDQMVSLSVSSGMTLEQIYEMTYRKFMKSISRMDLLIHYKIYSQASLSGMVEFKDKSFIKHWLNQIEENNSGDMVSMEEMSDKMNFKDKK